MSNFTPESLVTAVTQLFELNHYRVTGPEKINGAEVDLIATRKADPFARKIYLEVTIEYADIFAIFIVVDIFNRDFKIYFARKWISLSRRN